jgi:hypothetical protein
MADAAYIVSLTVLKRGALVPLHYRGMSLWDMVSNYRTARGMERGALPFPTLRPRRGQWHDNEGGGGTVALLNLGGCMFLYLGFVYLYREQVLAEHTQQIRSATPEVWACTGPPASRAAEGDQRRRGRRGCTTRFMLLFVPTVRCGY